MRLHGSASVSFLWAAAGGAACGGLVDGLTDARIGSATAEVAVHRGVDLGVRGMGRVGQQRDGRHDLAGLAVAALGHVELLPCHLDRVGAVGREALDGGDGPVADGADGRCRQERTGLPSSNTVHAPQAPIPQPYLAPFRSSVSRNAQSRGVSGGRSTVGDIVVDLQLQRHPSSPFRAELFWLRRPLREIVYTHWRRDVMLITIFSLGGQNVGRNGRELELLEDWFGGQAAGVVTI